VAVVSTEPERAGLAVYLNAVLRPGQGNEWIVPLGAGVATGGLDNSIIDDDFLSVPCGGSMGRHSDGGTAAAAAPRRRALRGRLPLRSREQRGPVLGLAGPVGDPPPDGGGGAGGAGVLPPGGAVPRHRLARGGEPEEPPNPARGGADRPPGCVETPLAGRWALRLGAVGRRRFGRGVGSGGRRGVRGNFRGHGCVLLEVVRDRRGVGDPVDARGRNRRVGRPGELAPPSPWQRVFW